jgi:hypothetical protein
MNSSHWMSRSLCAATTLLFAGCMAPGPYTYGTYPGYYAPPPQYGPPPGGTIVTPGGPGFPAPQLGPSSGPTPAWQPSPSSSPQLSPTPALSPPPSSSTPPGSSFNDSQPTFGPTNARRPIDNPVPMPTDRDPLGPATPMAPAGPTQRPSSSNVPFGAPEGTAEPFGKGAQLTIPQRPNVAVDAVATVDPQSFESPIEGERPAKDGLITVSAKAGPGGPIPKGTNPYSYDRAKYRWLQGKVDFEPRDRSWHIIYSDRPDPHDRHGGDIGLVGSGKLNTLHNGDFVYVEGRVDPQQLDSRGKPLYVIDGDQITRVPPGAATQSMGN